MAPLKKLLSLTAAALILLLGSAAPATAATPCWKQVINDWFDGRIDKTYPIPCYQQAIQHLPEDVQTYSSAADQISRALLEAIRHDRELGSEAQVQDRSNNHRSGDGPIAFGGGGSGGGGGDGHKGFIASLFDRFGPQNAESVPLPLLVLAAIALLLLAAAAASFVAKRIAARRMTPAPASARAPTNPGPKLP